MRNVGKCKRFGWISMYARAGDPSEKGGIGEGVGNRAGCNFAAICCVFLAIGFQTLAIGPSNHYYVRHQSKAASTAHTVLIPWIKTNVSTIAAVALATIPAMTRAEAFADTAELAGLAFTSLGIEEAAAVSRKDKVATYAMALIRRGVVSLPTAFDRNGIDGTALITSLLPTLGKASQALLADGWNQPKLTAAFKKAFPKRVDRNKKQLAFDADIAARKLVIDSIGRLYGLVYTHLEGVADGSVDKKEADKKKGVDKIKYTPDQKLTGSLLAALGILDDIEKQAAYQVAAYTAVTKVLDTLIADCPEAAAFKKRKDLSHKVRADKVK